MTRIETIFGGLLALAIGAVFLFVFFGQASSGPSERSYEPGQTRSLSTKASLSGLMSDDPDDYVAPTTACECYFLGYDMVREGISSTSTVFEGQVQTCYDNVGAMGASALGKGASDAAADPRERRSCRAGDYL